MSERLDKKVKYSEYTFGRKELIFNLMVIMGLFMILAFLFYGNALFAVIFIPLCYPALKVRKKQLIQKRYEVLSGQFKDMLLSMADAMAMGLSIENALVESCREMAILYGENSYICRELKEMAAKIKLNIPVEKVFHEFANRTELADVQIFVNTFEIGKKRGGNMVQMVRKTADNIRQKEETLEEIRVCINAKKMEQKIMTFIPMLIVVYMKFASPGFLDVMYDTALGRIIMTACLLVYGGAFLWAENIMSIEV